MSDQLHLKPNLDYLKRQARNFQKAYNKGDQQTHNWVKNLHPKFAHETDLELPEKLTLSDAQLVAARGYGFPSWPKLKSYIESINSDFATKIFTFLNAATPSPNFNHRSGTLDKAAEILAADPALAQADICTASVTGDAKTIEKLLQANPALVNEQGGPRNWQPILYLCFSRFLRFQPAKTPQFAEALKILLARGADPNVHFMCSHEIETPLYGAAGVANNARIMQILLEAGADVNDPDTHYHVAEFDNRACWRLLFEHGVNEVGKTTMLLRRLDFDDLEGVAELLKLGCDPNAIGYWGKAALHQTIMRGRRIEFVELLIEHGADVNAKRNDGKSVFALACRYGRKDVVALLRKHHASEEMSLADQFIGACSLEDDKRCDEILQSHPEIVKSLSADDKAAIVDAALEGQTKAVKMMLDAGFEVAQKGWLGGTALHAAAWKGFAETVELLLSRGAPVDLRDDTYQNTPLGWGAYGSSACRNPQGDYMRTVQSLVHAGSEIQKYMIDDASEEVAAWLREYMDGEK